MFLGYGDDENSRRTHAELRVSSPPRHQGPAEGSVTAGGEPVGRVHLVEPRQDNVLTLHAKGRATYVKWLPTTRQGCGAFIGAQ